MAAKWCNQRSISNGVAKVKLVLRSCLDNEEHALTNIIFASEKDFVTSIFQQTFI